MNISRIYSKLASTSKTNLIGLTVARPVTVGSNWFYLVRAGSVLVSLRFCILCLTVSTLFLTLACAKSPNCQRSTVGFYLFVIFNPMFDDLFFFTSCSDMMSIFFRRCIFLMYLIRQSQCYQLVWAAVTMETQHHAWNEPNRVNGWNIN